jgi:hypothetical protein
MDFLGPFTAENFGEIATESPKRESEVWYLLSFFSFINREGRKEGRREEQKGGTERRKRREEKNGKEWCNFLIFPCLTYVGLEWWDVGLLPTCYVSLHFFLCCFFLFYFLLTATEKQKKNSY